MDYEKLWNDMKERLVSAAEMEKSSIDSKDYLFYASALLIEMNRAEVNAFREVEFKEKELDTAFMESLFKKEGAKHE